MTKKEKAHQQLEADLIGPQFEAIWQSLFEAGATVRSTAAMREWIREREWAGHNGVCLGCRKTQYRGHAADCSWVKLMEGEKS